MNKEIAKKNGLIAIKVVMGYDIKDLESSRRERNLAFSRQLFTWYLTNANLNTCHFTSAEAGRVVNRDHSTVLYGNKLINSLIDFKQMPWVKHINDFIKITKVLSEINEETIDGILITNTTDNTKTLFNQETDVLLLHYMGNLIVYSDGKITIISKNKIKYNNLNPDTPIQQFLNFIKKELLITEE